MKSPDYDGDSAKRPGWDIILDRIGEEHVQVSKFLVTTVALLSLTLTAAAQTETALANNYGHHEVYEAQPGVQMTAKFASNGLVCEMQIEQEHFLKKEVDMTYGIDKDRISGLIDRLVPLSERGKKENKFPGGMILGTGQVMETLDRYANVDVHVLSTIPNPDYTATSVIIINWRNRPCLH